MEPMGIGEHLETVNAQSILRTAAGMHVFACLCTYCDLLLQVLLRSGICNYLHWRRPIICMIVHLLTSIHVYNYLCLHVFMCVYIYIQS